MSRALVAGLGLCVCFGLAEAGGGRKVDVDSDPAGASVYLNDVDSGELCKTPCSIDAPVGTTPIIIRKDGYTPEISEITVPKRGKVSKFKVSLKSEVGTIVVSDPALKGGRVFVDDIDKGPAPQKLDVPAGPHHVSVLIKGKPVADDIINLDAGDEHEVKASAAPPLPPVVSDATTVKSGGFDDDGGEVKPQGTKIKVAVTEPDRLHRPFISVGADFDVGFRQFKYDNAGGGLSATESESGQTMLGPAVELWPTVLAGSSHLQGLSLFGKFEFGLNHQAVLDTANMPVGPTTFWGNIEVDLRHRWSVGDASSVAIEGGFVRDQLQFNAATKEDLQKVPVTDYKSVKLGVQAATTMGPFQPFVEVEGRIPFSGGDLQTRFASHDISGYHAALGFTVGGSTVFLRAQAAITYYSWTFTNSSTTGPTADGATDKIEVISVVLGLTH
jgi:PEGA domain